MALLWMAVLVVSAGRAKVDRTLSPVFPLLVYWLVNAAFSSDINGNRELWITLGVASALLVTGVTPLGGRTTTAELPVRLGKRPGPSQLMR